MLRQRGPVTKLTTPLMVHWLLPTMVLVLEILVGLVLLVMLLLVLVLVVLVKAFVIPLVGFPAEEVVTISLQPSNISDTQLRIILKYELIN